MSEPARAGEGQVVGLTRARAPLPDEFPQAAGPELPLSSLPLVLPAREDDSPSPSGEVIARLAAAFTIPADLVNARPTGTIQTTGTFGPWSTEDPGQIGVQGQYTFDNANLGDFRDIAGTLHSTGRYTGTLRELSVDGVADVQAPVLDGPQAVAGVEHREA